MKAVMYGAGNIGRGFIGGTFYKSGYEVVFIDINKEVISRINADREYPVVIAGHEGNREEIVKNVRAVDGTDAAAVANEILTCGIMATAVGVNVLKHIAAPVAKGVSARIAAKKPLNILLCENLIDANHYFKGELFKYLSDSDKADFDKYIGLVEASIGRMVPVLTDNGGNILRVAVEEFDVLHLDKDGFRGGLPKLYNTVIYSPFNYYIQRKLFIHNMCHSLCAYLGYLKGYEYIYQAVSDIEILYAVKSAGLESASAISRDMANDKLQITNYKLRGGCADVLKHPVIAPQCRPSKILEGNDMAELTAFLDKLLYRFNNPSLKDTVARVGGDPVRKLSAQDRFCGAYSLCKKYGIDASFISLGIAAALTYDNTADISADKVQEFIKSNGIEKAIDNFTQSAVLPKDKTLITGLYNNLKNKTSLRDINFICQKNKAISIEN